MALLLAALTAGMLRLWGAEIVRWRSIRTLFPLFSRAKPAEIGHAKALIGMGSYWQWYNNRG